MTDRDKALSLLNQYIKDSFLLKHCLMVEAAMKHFATVFNDDKNADQWAIVGLLHDIDYEKYPTEHCLHTREILQPAGYSDEIIRAIESHGYNIVNNIKPATLLEKTLYTVDELSGLIYAVAILRPSHSFDDLTVKSVIKKWKQNTFAKNCNREVISSGAQMLDMPLNDIISHTIDGLRPIGPLLGLDTLIND